MAVLIHYRSRLTQNTVKKKKQAHTHADIHRYFTLHFNGSWIAKLKEWA